MWNEWGELSQVKNELNKLYGLIVGKNVLQSPLGFWGRYDAWREAVKGLEEAIKEIEEKYGCERCYKEFLAKEERDSDKR